MPFYGAIDNRTPVGRRTAEGLLRLKKALDSTVPAKTLDQTLLLASWNIREFGGNKSDGRDKEALFYLAEIISRFDLIAIQEVRDDLDALDGLMGLLGGSCKIQKKKVKLALQDNNQRHAYIIDKQKL